MAYPRTLLPTVEPSSHHAFGNPFVNSSKYRPHVNSLPPRDRRTDQVLQCHNVTVLTRLCFLSTRRLGPMAINGRVPRKQSGSLCDESHPVLCQLLLPPPLRRTPHSCQQLPPGPRRSKPWPTFMISSIPRCWHPKTGTRKVPTSPRPPAQLTASVTKCFYRPRKFGQPAHLTNWTGNELALSLSKR